MALGPAGAWLFASLHGAGNGTLTIAKETLPLLVFGSNGYEQRQGWLVAPARLAQALAPLLFGLAIMHWSNAALRLIAALGCIPLTFYMAY